MKSLSFVFLALVVLGGCKIFNKYPDQTQIIGEAIIQIKDKCYCSITNTSYVSELADTVEYSFNFNNIIQVDTSYNEYVIININSEKNIKRKIYWRNYISEDEKKRFSKEKRNAIFFFIQKDDYDSFVELIYTYANKCNASLKK